MHALFIRALYLDQSFGQLERGLDGIVEATAILGSHHEPVHDDRDVVVHPPIQLRGIRDFDEIAVYDRADETLFARRVEQLPELSFAAAHERRENFDLGSFGPGEDGVGYLSGALAFYRASAVRAVGRPRPGVEQSEVVVDLRDGPDRRPRIVPGGLLLDGNGGRQPLDGVDVRLLHEAEELTRVCGQRFHVPTLAFRIYSIERERGLPRT